MVILALAALSAQFHFGVKAALTLTPDLDRRVVPQSEDSVRINRGTVGPFLEYKLFRRLPAIETGLLYRRLCNDSYFGPFPNAALNYITRTATVFDVPLLRKARRNSWFVSAAATIRRIGDYNQSSLVIPRFQGFSPSQSSTRFQNKDLLRYGITAALGYTKPVWRISLEPELRLTRWTALRQTPYQNQIDLMLGVRF
ncbi:MAG: hypothetical protein FJW36_15985 [Acidobacteria bacterium]|nr:hypothetical protein [Acidobacteriota bacterium]